MGHWEASWTGDVLGRIVALLFALADLADRAACAPCSRRRHVLEILNCGEAAARAFLIGTPACTPVPVDATATTGDAVRLAARLRVLALLLCALLARRYEGPGTAGPQARRGEPARPAAREAAAAAPDTS